MNIEMPEALEKAMYERAGIPESERERNQPPLINAWFVGFDECFDEMANKQKWSSPERVKILTDALEYYADRNRWESTTHESTRDGVGCGDFELIKTGISEGYEQVGGKRARTALLEFKGGADE